MNKADYIIGVRDVFNNTDISQDESPKNVCRYLDCAVLALKKCFGTYYKQIIGSIAEYKTAVLWCPELFTIGKIVYYEGCYYERIEEEEHDVEQAPYCSAGWKKLDKFKSECLNEIWNELSKYLSAVVHYEAFPFLESTNDTDLAADWYNIKIRALQKQCNKRLQILKDRIIEICEEGRCQEFLQIDFVNDVCGKAECKTDSNGCVGWR